MKLGLFWLRRGNGCAGLGASSTASGHYGERRSAGLAPVFAEVRLEKSRRVLNRKRLACEIPLYLVAIELLQVFVLLRRFDAFRYDFQSQALRECNDCFDNRRILGVAGNVLDERA